MLKYTSVINSTSGDTDEVTTFIPAGHAATYDVTAVMIVREITPETGTGGTLVSLNVGEHRSGMGSWTTLPTTRNWSAEYLDRLTLGAGTASVVQDSGNKYRMQVHGDQCLAVRLQTLASALTDGEYQVDIYLFAEPPGADAVPFAF